MPAYQIYVSKGSVSAQRKDRLAQAVTGCHSEATGANPFFAQVLFHEFEPGSLYLGGSRIREHQVFVHGFIRARDMQIKEKLIEALLRATMDATDLPRRNIWVYVSDLPPQMMVEYGHTLPEPGREAEWIDQLPPEDRAYMMASQSHGQS
jgi:phenylpyruvate tautomerase PptA (4-oxalocrotonate tautomerase family)